MNRDLNTKVSVIMPVYNGESFLNESVQSILNQTFKNFQFIIINDGSTDKTLRILKKFKRNDKRIILIDNKKNMGASKSFNIGLKRAKGKYVACFCADDISHPKRLEAEFNYLERNPCIFLVGTSGIYINERGKEIRRFRKYNNYKLLAWRLRKSCSILFPSIMFRNMPDDEKIYLDDNFSPADDYNLYFELIKKGKSLTNLSPFLVKVRIHPGGMSSYKNKRQEELRMQILKKFNELKDNTNIFDKIYFSALLLIHHLKTRNEKKVR